MIRGDITIKSLTSLLLSLFIVVTFLVIISVVAKIFLSPKRKMIILFSKITRGEFPNELLLLPMYDILYDTKNEKWYLIKINICSVNCDDLGCSYTCTNNEYYKNYFEITKQYDFLGYCKRSFPAKEIALAIKILKTSSGKVVIDKEKYLKYLPESERAWGYKIENNKRGLEILSLRIMKLSESLAKKGAYPIYILFILQEMIKNKENNLNKIVLLIPPKHKGLSPLTVTCDKIIDNLERGLRDIYITKQVSVNKKELLSIIQ